MSEKKVVRLKYPIPVPDPASPDKEHPKIITIDSLLLGRLKVKHLRALPEKFFEGEDKVSAADMIPLIAMIAGIPESSVDEIDLEDLTVVGKEIESFLSQFLETGEKSSGE